MPPTKPLLLLDVDGVLCPIGPGPGEPMRTLVIEDWPFIFCETLPARLSTLGERFTLVWATSWEHGANRLLAPALGLPDLPVISFAGPAARPGRTWKLTAVQRFVGRQAMAWVEDNLVTTRTPGPGSEPSPPCCSTSIRPGDSPRRPSTHSSRSPTSSAPTPERTSRNNDAMASRTPASRGPSSSRDLCMADSVDGV
jgi:hypothetical protein